MIKTHASLFSGIGAAEIAADWMGWQSLFHCEIQEFPRKVLEYWYPNAVSYEDITKTDFTPWRGKIDILTGGFPCQAFSMAGKRLGDKDHRYLWPEMLRAIREIQPSWVVGENVTGLLSMVQSGEEAKMGRTDDLFEANYIYRKEQRFTLDEICEGLERAGYAVQPFVVPACAVGAPHRRDRIWIVARRIQDPVAHSADAGSETMQCKREYGVYAAGLAADTLRTGRQELDVAAEPREALLADSEGDGVRWKQPRLADAGLPSDRWADFPTQSPVCSRHDGVSLGLVGITFPRWRAEAVKALGNAMVPQVVYEIFRAIEQVENEKQ